MMVLWWTVQSTIIEWNFAATLYSRCCAKWQGENLSKTKWQQKSCKQNFKLEDLYTSKVAQTFSNIAENQWFWPQCHHEGKIQAFISNSSLLYITFINALIPHKKLLDEWWEMLSYVSIFVTLTV